MATPAQRSRLSPQVGCRRTSVLLLPRHSRRLACGLACLETWLAVLSGVQLAVAPADSLPLCALPGEEWRQRPRQAAVIRLFSYTFFNKIIMRHDTGMGESYMDGDYEVRFAFDRLQVDRTCNCLHTTEHIAGQ